MSLIPHPEIQRLMELNAELRAGLADLLAHAHDLVRTVRPNLLAIYQSKLGAWELEKLKAQFRVARLKRVIELALKREPQNPHDALAIMIFTEEGHHLGYIPRAKNEALARLMNAGKLLFGRLESKEWQGAWLKAQMRVFMRDF